MKSGIKVLAHQLILAMCTGVALCHADESAVQPQHFYPYAIVRPIGFEDVTINDGFIKTVRDRSRDVGVPSYMAKFEEHGEVQNYRIVVNNILGEKGEHYLRANVDEFVYKQLEAMGIYAAESEEIARLHKVLDEILVHNAAPPVSFDSRNHSSLRARQRA